MLVEICLLFALMFVLAYWFITKVNTVKLPNTARSHVFNAITVGELVLHIYIYIDLALSMIRYPYTFRYLSYIYGNSNTLQT